MISIFFYFIFNKIYASNSTCNHFKEGVEIQFIRQDLSYFLSFANFFFIHKKEIVSQHVTTLFEVVTCK